MSAVHPPDITVPAPSPPVPVARRPGRWRRWTLVLLTLGAAGVFLVAKLTSGGGDAPSGGGQRYQTATVARRHLREVVSATGTLNPLISVTVGAEVSGVVREVFVDYNSPVRAGQPVARIDTANYRAALTQAEGELANARAGLKLAEANLRRQGELFARNMLAAADHDTAVANVEQARAAVQTRQGARDKTATDLEHCTILSPIDGVVTSRAVDVGQTVASLFNTPTLFTIAADLRRMQIDASVAEADIGGVAAGQAVEFTVDAYPAATFRGRVKGVHHAPMTTSSAASTGAGAASTTGVVSYDAVVEVDNADGRLKPGMTPSVNVILTERADALAVPNAALRFRPPAGAMPAGSGTDAPADARRVYLATGNDGRLTAREVRAGITDGTHTELLDGPGEGERVVVAVLSAGPTKFSLIPPPPGDFR